MPPSRAPAPVAALPALGDDAAKGLLVAAFAAVMYKGLELGVDCVLKAGGVGGRQGRERAVCRLVPARAGAPPAGRPPPIPRPHLPLFHPF